MKYVHRDIEKELFHFLKMFPAVAITGPRQSGKSTLLKEILGEKYKYISFDDTRLRERAKTDPSLFLGELGNKIILDEIQYVPELLSYIKIEIDSHRDKRGQFIITGSQQFQLIKNLGDSLAGRIGLLNLLPFGIKEVGSIKKYTSLSTKSYFLNSCLKGSYPEPITKSRINVENWYNSYMQTYLERDVRGIYGVGDLLDFQKFMQLLSGRCSQILNLSSLANDLGVAVTTIKNWLSILVASQIVYLLPPYFKNFGKRVVKSPKIYFTDCGLVTHLLSLKTRELILYGPLAGALFENYVISETLKSYYSIGRRPNLYYFRTHKGLEIDLILTSGLNIIPFEIKITQTPNRSMTQNIDKIKEISKEVDLKFAGLVTLSKDSYHITRNAKVYSLSDFLQILPQL